MDRSAAYMARHVAKNIVAAGLAKKCQIELAYAIGVARPVSVLIDTYGTGVLPDEKLAGIVDEVFDLRPASIIDYLNLRRPIYEQTAAYGHFGRPDLDLPWESPDQGGDPEAVPVMACGLGVSSCKSETRQTRLCLPGFCAGWGEKKPRRVPALLR